MTIKPSSLNILLLTIVIFAALLLVGPITFSSTQCGGSRSNVAGCVGHQVEETIYPIKDYFRCRRTYRTGCYRKIQIPSYAALWYPNLIWKNIVVKVLIAAPLAYGTLYLVSKQHKMREHLL